MYSSPSPLASVGAMGGYGAASGALYNSTYAQQQQAQQKIQEAVAVVTSQALGQGLGPGLGQGLGQGLGAGSGLGQGQSGMYSTFGSILPSPTSAFVPVNPPPLTHHTSSPSPTNAGSPWDLGNNVTPSLFQQHPFSLSQHTHPLKHTFSSNTNKYHTP